MQARVPTRIRHWKLRCCWLWLWLLLGDAARSSSSPSDRRTTIQHNVQHAVARLLSAPSVSSLSTPTRAQISAVPVVQWSSGAKFDVNSTFVASEPVVIRGFPVNETTFMRLAHRRAAAAAAAATTTPVSSVAPRLRHTQFLEALAQLRGSAPLEFFSANVDTHNGGTSDKPTPLDHSGHSFASVYDDFALQRVAPLHVSENFNRTWLTMQQLFERNAMEQQQHQRHHRRPLPGLVGDIMFAKATLANFGLVGAAEADFETSGGGVSLFEQLVGHPQHTQEWAVGDNGDGRSASATALHLDADVWIGTAGAISHPHYDLQHNMYIQLDGAKAFFLAPMPIPVAFESKAAGDTEALLPTSTLHNSNNGSDGGGGSGGEADDRPAPTTTDLRWLFPAVHGRHRQVKHHLVDPLRFNHVQGVVLEAGDILYIPPLHLHSGTALTPLSASMSVCTDSTAENAARDLQLAPLPFEMSWPLQQRVQSVAYFCSLLIRTWLDGRRTVTMIPTTNTTTTRTKTTTTLRSAPPLGPGRPGREDAEVEEFVRTLIRARYVGSDGKDEGEGSNSVFGPSSPAGGGGDARSMQKKFVETQWDAVRAACAGSGSGNVTGSAAVGQQHRQYDWLDGALAAKMRARAHITIERLIHETKERKNARAPAPRQQQQQQQQQQTPGNRGSTGDEQPVSSSMALPATPPTTTTLSSTTTTTTTTVEQMQALLLADHVDVLSNFMVGPSAAFAMLSLCYSKADCSATAPS